MKSEHRHELAENDLSKLLGRWMEKFDEHANTILSVIVVVALIAAAFIWWSRTSRYERASGWSELAASSSPDDYANVADAFSGTPVADWARLRAGNGYLHEGVRDSITNRTASNERLSQAREAFESLTSSSGTPPAVREQALNGLAVTLESLSNGDTEPAIAAYQQLLKEFPETRFKEWAEDRIEVLKQGRVQEFYAWFHDQNPKPPEMPLPQDQSSPLKNMLGPVLEELGGAGIPDDVGAPSLGDTPFELPAKSDDNSPPPAEDINPFEGQSESDSSAEETESPQEGVETPTGDGTTPEDTDEPAPQ